MQHEADPIITLREIGNNLKHNGLIILSTRLGSGFDILTLKGSTSDIFPYEHIMLPSKVGLEMILDEAGYELLEITTPGTRDINEVLNNQERIDDNNLFVRQLLRTADRRTLSDFQQFLQRSLMSSFAQLIARKR